MLSVSGAVLLGSLEQEVNVHGAHEATSSAGALTTA
jgi:hypothetical protein